MSTAKRSNTQVISLRSDRQGVLKHWNDEIRRFEKIGQKHIDIIPFDKKNVF
jgi:alkyl hydroperoxide reductase subunit AhpC